VSIELWLAFVAASAVLLIIPGPTVLTVISYAVARGRHVSTALVAGVALGDSTALLVSLLGLGALLAASALAFTVAKLVGGLYLLYLGIRMLRAGFTVTEITERAAPESRRRVFLGVYLVTAFNPKSIMFFVAFLPQFVNRSADVTQQLVLLAVTFVVMAAANAGMYSVFAGSANRLLSSPRAQKRLNLAGGSLLSAAGIWALLARHSA
jgi:threonine/homoserine/homoserine lactone efflux protein